MDSFFASGSQVETGMEVVGSDLAKVARHGDGQWDRMVEVVGGEAGGLLLETGECLCCRQQGEEKEENQNCWERRYELLWEHSEWLLRVTGS